GIPTHERAITCKKISDASTKLNDFRYPGHVTLIGAKDFWYRKGHSESSVELVKMLGFSPYSVIIEILDENGDSHNLDYVYKLARKNNLLILSIKDVWKEYVKNNNLLSIKSKATLPTEFGIFKIISFERSDTTFNRDLANVKNFQQTIDDFALFKEFEGIPIVRVHSECVTGDCLNSLRCDCGSQLSTALRVLQKYGGVLLYLRQEGRGIGLEWKVKAYELQDKGFDTYDANVALGFRPDERDYAIAVQMLKALQIKKVRLLTNNPEKVKQLENYGIEVVERIPLYGNITKSNAEYIKTKVEKFGHLFDDVIKF
ncbi:MAG: GTP cyclohydrolase II, partial [Fervidobacterium sp.]